MSQQELAQQLVREGGTLVLLGMPPGTEFGIDVNFWNIGERFRGVKMIPPGLHFIYFSAVNRQGDTAPRTGFFHVFAAREVVVRHYDPVAEDLKVEETNAEEVERIRSNLREMDRFLGPYPLDSWRKWISLTQHVDERELQRMIPLSGRVCSVAELTPVAPFRSSRGARQSSTPSTSTTEAEARHPQATDSTTSTREVSDSSSSTPQLPDTDTSVPQHSDSSSPTTQHPDTSTSTPQHPDSSTSTPQHPDSTSEPKAHPQLPEMVPKEGTEFRFTQPPKKAYRDGASPSEVTHYSLDSSYSVRHMLSQVDRPESLLAELQLAFVSFLVGQVWSGWEHWRRLVGELCRAEEMLVETPELYSKLLSALHYQVNEIPEDLFVDIVESNNFFASALSNLFANINDNAATLPPPLVLKARRFKDHLTAKFDWDLTLGDDGEYAPVVVDT